MAGNSHESDPPPEAVRYYKTDVQGMTYRELRRVFGGWIPFLIMAVVKLLGIHKRLGLAVAHPREFVLLEPDQLPPRAREVLETAVAEWERQGLHPAFCWTLTPGPLGDVEIAAAAVLSDDGAVSGATVYTRVCIAGYSQEQIISGASSKMPDGVVLSTTTRSPDYEELPHRRVHYLAGRTIAALVAHHRYRLRNVPLEPVRFTPATLRDHLQQEQRRQVEALIERGLLVPMSLEAVEAERRRFLARPIEPSTPQAVPREESANPYQSPGASGWPAASPGPADDRPIPLAWPLVVLWLSWPPIVLFLSAFLFGTVPPLGFFLLIVLASNAGFVENLYRRRVIHRGWVRLSVWALILVGQIAAAGAAVAAATGVFWILGRLPY